MLFFSLVEITRSPFFLHLTCSTESQSNKAVLYLSNLANNNLQNYDAMSESKFAWSIVAENVLY